MSSTEVHEVATPGGPARLHVDRAGAERARLLVGHGAGGGVEAPDLVALAATLPRRGITVVRLEQPWRVAGRRLAGRPATLDEAQRAVLERWDDRMGTGPLVLGGRSAGARSACRVAAAATGWADLLGVICLAFPLHPPRGSASRAAELDEVLTAGLPLHVVQGSRDAFGGAEQVRGAVPAPGVTVTEVLLADHAFAVPVRAGRAAGTSTADALQGVADSAAGALLGWLDGPFDPRRGDRPE